MVDERIRDPCILLQKTGMPRFPTRIFKDRNDGKSFKRRIAMS